MRAVMLLRRKNARVVSVALDVPKFSRMKRRLGRSLPIGRVIVERVREIHSCELCKAIGHGKFVQSDRLLAHRCNVQRNECNDQSRICGEDSADEVDSVVTNLTGALPCCADDAVEKHTANGCERDGGRPSPLHEADDRADPRDDARRYATAECALDADGPIRSDRYVAEIGDQVGVAGGRLPISLETVSAAASASAAAAATNNMPSS